MERWITSGPSSHRVKRTIAKEPEDAPVAARLRELVAFAFIRHVVGFEERQGAKLVIRDPKEFLGVRLDQRRPVEGQRGEESPLGWERIDVLDRESMYGKRTTF